MNRKQWVGNSVETHGSASLREDAGYEKQGKFCETGGYQLSSICKDAARHISVTTSFSPNFNNKTTSVARICSSVPTSFPHFTHKNRNNEVMKSGYVCSVSATEVVLFFKLGGNEVFF
jgi:hypothetical protein